MPNPIAFAAAYAERAPANPSVPAVVFPDQTLTHDNLRRLGLAFAARMREAGIGRVRVCNCARWSRFWSLPSFWAPPGSGPNSSPSRETTRPRPHSSRRITFTTPRPRPLRPPAHAIDEARSPATSPAFDTTNSPDPDAAWLWVHTSGATGLPKLLALSQMIVVGR